MTLTVDRLKELFSYDQDKGMFYRLIATNPRAQIGPVHGTKNSAGYPRIFIDGRSYLAHRLAWFFVHGRWPTADLDHINGDQADYRFSNLREATRSENMANARRGRQNTSGVKGVSFNKAGGKWVAYVQMNGVHHHLGAFPDRADAVSARVNAAVNLHGEFARVQ